MGPDTVSLVPSQFLRVWTCISNAFQNTRQTNLFHISTTTPAQTRISFRLNGKSFSCSFRLFAMAEHAWGCLCPNADAPCLDLEQQEAPTVQESQAMIREASGPFNFGQLPVELRLRVLSHTHLGPASAGDYHAWHEELLIRDGKLDKDNFNAVDGSTSPWFIIFFSFLFCSISSPSPVCSHDWHCRKFTKTKASSSPPTIPPRPDATAVSSLWHSS